MENRRADRIDKLRKRVSDYLAEGIIKISVLTDSNGFEIEGKKKKFYEKAHLSAEKKKTIKDGSICWLPVIFEGDVLAVAGVKDTKGYPKEAAKLINGIVGEIVFDEFLERQINQSIDPVSTFIKDLVITNRFGSFEEAIDQGDILGINLRAPQAVILIKIPGFTQKAHKKHVDTEKNNLILKMNEECRALTDELSAAFKNYEQNIFSCLSPDLYICLKWARGQVNTLNTIKFYREKATYIQEIVEKRTKIKPTIGVGQYYPGLAGLKKSYTDAKVALNLGERIWGEGKIYHIVDVGMFVALTPEIPFERKCELAHQIMGKVFTDKDLHKTVNVFLEKDMNLSLAAKSLHLHRNTLIYRLNKIKSTIGLDPRKFSDAVQLKLGLILYDPNKEC